MPFFRSDAGSFINHANRVNLTSQVDLTDHVFLINPAQLRKLQKLSLSRQLPSTPVIGYIKIVMAGLFF